MPSPELEAMATIEEAFDPLDDDVRVRVLGWALAKYSTAKPVPTSSSQQQTSANPSVAPVVVGEIEDVPLDTDSDSEIFEHFADLYDLCSPESLGDKYLVAAYWVQVVNGTSPFTNMAVNSHLRNQGHPLSAINRVAENLRKERPVPLNQVSKGKSQQAKKMLKLSTEGVRRVELMVSNAHSA